MRASTSTSAAVGGSLGRSALLVVRLSILAWALWLAWLYATGPPTGASSAATHQLDVGSPSHVLQPPRQRPTESSALTVEDEDDGMDPIDTAPKSEGRNDDELTNLDAAASPSPSTPPPPPPSASSKPVPPTPAVTNSAAVTTSAAVTASAAASRSPPPPPAPSQSAGPSKAVGGAQTVDIRGSGSASSATALQRDRAGCPSMLPAAPGLDLDACESPIINSLRMVNAGASAMRAYAGRVAAAVAAAKAKLASDTTVGGGAGGGAAGRISSLRRRLGVVVGGGDDATTAAPTAAAERAVSEATRGRSSGSDGETPAARSLATDTADAAISSSKNIKELSSWKAMNETTLEDIKVNAPKLFSGVDAHYRDIAAKFAPAKTDAAPAESARGRQ